MPTKIYRIFFCILDSSFFWYFTPSHWRAVSSWNATLFNCFTSYYFIARRLQLEAKPSLAIPDKFKFLTIPTVIIRLAQPVSTVVSDSQKNISIMRQNVRIRQTNNTPFSVLFVLFPEQILKNETQLQIDVFRIFCYNHLIKVRPRGLELGFVKRSDLPLGIQGLDRGSLHEIGKIYKHFCQ